MRLLHCVSPHNLKYTSNDKIDPRHLVIGGAGSVSFAERGLL